MVVLSAVICTKAGKAIVARQFVEMTRIRIEGLLTAFPKLLSTDAKQQHTFIETEAVRYVYQPLDTLYLLLITNRASNIVEDLDTLRLLSKGRDSFALPPLSLLSPLSLLLVTLVVPSITGTTANLTEDKVADKCFDLIFAFDEVTRLSQYYPTPHTNCSFQQIRKNMEMDSPEEQAHNMIRSIQMESAKNQAAAAAQAIKDRQREQQRLGISGNSTSFAGSNISSYDSPSISAPPSSIPSVPSPISQPSRSQAVKGMSLGTGGKNKALEEALMKEDKIAPLVSNISKPPSTDHHSHAAATPLIQHPLMLAVTEKVSAKISKDGLTELLEVKGQLMLTAASDDVSNFSIKLKPINNSAFAFNTHPKINKQVYEKSSILQLKEAGKGFPSGRAVGILKWTSNGVNEDLIPIRINCWPEEESRGQVNVSMEYSMDLKNFELHDVRIIIPLRTSASPNVVNADGNYKHNSSSNELVWELDLIDSSNSSGSLEFNIQQKNIDAFFPIHVHFSSKRQYCPIDVLQITSMTSEDHIPYGIMKGLSSEEYVIGLFRN